MEKANLVHYGTNLMLDRVLKDLQVPKSEAILCFAQSHAYIVIRLQRSAPKKFKV